MLQIYLKWDLKNCKRIISNINYFSTNAINQRMLWFESLWANTLLDHSLMWHRIFKVQDKEMIQRSKYRVFQGTNPLMFAVKCHYRCIISLCKPLRTPIGEKSILRDFFLVKWCTLPVCGWGDTVIWQITEEGHLDTENYLSVKLDKKKIEIITHGLPVWQSRVSSSPHMSSSVQRDPCYIFQLKPRV